MTEAEKVLLVKRLCDETDAEAISAFLTLAGDTLYSRGDPYKTMDKAAFLDMYAVTQVKAAAYYINKGGWDFQKSHSENGITRTYEGGDLPDSILRDLTPRAGAVK